MGTNFSQIKIGSLFTSTDGETFKKTSELTYDDMAGLERYIDPFFEKKIKVEAAAEAPVEEKKAKKKSTKKAK